MSANADPGGRHYHAFLLLTLSRAGAGANRLEFSHFLTLLLKWAGKRKAPRKVVGST